MPGFQFSAYESAIALGVFVIAFLGLLVLKVGFARQLGRLASSHQLEILSYPTQIARATKPALLGFIALLIALEQLTLTPRQEKWLHYAWTITLVLQIAVWINCVVTVAVERGFTRHRGSDPVAAARLMTIGSIARVAVWAIAVLAALDNLGFNITTLMASLGIGGIAVALAAQNILGDVFSSISIALDKPFVIGDFIVVDDYMGTVEYVGLKTTRLRSLGGEQIIFSNTELLKNRIRNYKRMEERRVQFQINVAYETPPDLVEMIPGIVRQIFVSENIQAELERVHFKSYGENALQFEVVYFVPNPDYNKYMDIQQQLNLTLMRRFKEVGISFAHSLRTAYVTSGTNAAGTQSMRRSAENHANRPSH